jgi:hypothetical protein
MTEKNDEQSTEAKCLQNEGHLLKQQATVFALDMAFRAMLHSMAQMEPKTAASISMHFADIANQIPLHVPQPMQQAKGILLDWKKILDTDPCSQVPEQSN